MHRRISRSLCGALLAAGALAGSAAAAGPATVTVRVEGASRTLVPTTRLTTTTTPVRKDSDPSHTCTGTSVAGALEQATGGQWTASWFEGAGYFVSTIRGEAAPGDTGFWELWVNGKEAQTGICASELQQGDTVLFLEDRCDNAQPPDYACQNPPALPLVVHATRALKSGGQLTATVVKLSPAGEESPVAGATVTEYDRAGRVGVGTTGSDGTVSLGSVERSVSLRAHAPGLVRSEWTRVCVYTRDDGTCGRPDRTPPRLRTISPRPGQRFAARRGPRDLTGLASDPSGIRDVRLRLARVAGGPCARFDGARAEFVAARCGRLGRAFSIGDRADWDYLLPAKLSRGRYVLEVTAVDAAGNRRTTTVRFRVG